MSWCIHDSIELEKAGIPTLAIVSQEFLGLAVEDAAGFGLPGLPLITVPLPRGGVGSIEAEAARAKADEVFDDLLKFLTIPSDVLPSLQREYLERFPEARAAREASGARRTRAQYPEIEVIEDSLEGVLKLIDLWTDRGWTDGHPVIPPARERVAELIRASGRDPEDVVAILPPKYGVASVSKIAANAVMAGCGPEHMPILLAAVEALADESLLLTGLQKTTHNLSPLLMINGPIRHELRISCGEPGTSWRANASVGRAVRFIVMNISDLPGRANVVTHGWLGKYMYCVGENEEKSPWEPLHVERGFQASDSTVTVFPAEPPHNIDDQASTSAQGVLTTIAGTMASVGSEDFINRGEPLIMLGPEHAQRIGNGGFTREDVQSFLFEHARIPLGMVSPEYTRIFSERMKKLYVGVPAEYRLPMADRPEDFLVTVVGGLGQHSMWIATMGGSRAVTKLVPHLNHR